MLAEKATAKVGNSGNVDSVRSRPERVLCILDDPLTSLDAHTRDHVAKHFIHGILRRNRGIAVVMTCGGMDETRGTSD